MKIIDGLLPDMTIVRDQIGGSRVIDLEEGQVLNVRVVSYEKDNAILKTEEGYILRAKLDTGIVLEQGLDVTLVVAEQSNRVFVLKHYSEMFDRPFSEPMSLGSSFDHHFSGELSEKIEFLLKELDLHSSKEIIVYIQELVEQNPQLSPEKIIFLAMNKIEPSEIGSILSGDTGMVKTLCALIDMFKTDILDKLQNTNEADEELKPSGIPGNGGENHAGHTDGMPALSSRTPVQMSNRSALPGLRPEYNIDETESSGVGETNQTNSNQRFFQINEQLHITSDSRPESMEIDSIESITDMVMPDDVSKAHGTNKAEKQFLVDTGPAVKHLQISSEVDAGTQRLLKSLLSRMPAFEKGMGKGAEEIREIILNAFAQVQTLKNGGKSIAEEAKKFFNGMYAKLIGDQSDGARLKRAFEELYTKLHFLREALPGMELNHKAEMLELTQRLMGHMQTTSGIEQFVYMQIPVWLSGEHTEAELYIFKKNRGTKKIDPENIKILLALNLTNIGHIESLIGIKGKEVSLRIEMSEKSYESSFLKNTIKLYKMLAEIGYKLVNMSVTQLKRETTVETAMFKLMDLERDRKLGLDLTI